MIEPCERSWAIRCRQPGRAGSKRIAFVMFGGTATIALRALTARPGACATTPSSDQEIAETGASSLTRSPRRSASPIAIACEPPTTRLARHCSGSKSS